MSNDSAALNDARTPDIPAAINATAVVRLLTRPNRAAATPPNRLY